MGPSATRHGSRHEADRAGGRGLGVAAVAHLPGRAAVRPTSTLRTLVGAADAAADAVGDDGDGDRCRVCRTHAADAVDAAAVEAAGREEGETRAADSRASASWTSR